MSSGSCDRRFLDELDVDLIADYSVAVYPAASLGGSFAIKQAQSV
jgi:hypothetical protein